MKKLNNPDEAFQKAFEGFKPELPVTSWSAIQEGIYKVKIENAVSLQNRYRSIAMLLAALLLLASLGFVYQFSKDKLSDRYALTGNEQSKDNGLIDTVYVNQQIVVHDTIYLKKYLPLNRKDIDPEILLANKPLRDYLLSILSKEPIDFLPHETTEHEPTYAYASPDSLESLPISYLTTTIPVSSINSLQQSKGRKMNSLQERIPFSERVFYQVLAGGTTGKLIDFNQRESFGQNNGNELGLFAGVQLSDRLWIRTGVKLELQEYSLIPDGRVRLYPERISDVYQFVYRSPLGNLIIPNESLSSPVTQSSSIEIESHNNNHSKQLFIPLHLNYDILQKDVKFLGYYRPLEIYAGLGASFQKPLQSTVSLEVYQNDASEFDLTLKKFSSVSNLLVGGQMQIGGKLEVYPGWKLMSEFSAHRNLTYYVNNEYFRSFNRGLAFSGGLEIKLK